MGLIAKRGAELYRSYIVIKVKLVSIQIRLLQLKILYIICREITRKISAEYAQKEMRKEAKRVTTKKKSTEHSRKQ